MTDAVAVFAPGFRVLDSSGDPVSGAQVKFYDGGTSTPKTVYSDATLSTSLGSIVYSRSDGQLVSEQNGSTTVAVYVGVGLYDVEIVDANDVSIFPRKINQKGALDTSGFLSSDDTSLLIVPVSTVTDVTLTLDSDDRGTLINVNSTGGNKTVALPLAASLDENWSVRIRKGSASNLVTVQTTGGEFIDETLTSIILRDKGDVLNIVCDGTQFFIMSSRIKARENQVGDIRFCAAGVARTGELECNGQSYLRATYPELYAWIANKWGTADGTHFNVPYMSGSHLRIWDHGAGIDPDAASRSASLTGGASGDNVGSYQADGFKTHTHTLPNGVQGTSFSGSPEVFTNAAGVQISSDNITGAPSQGSTTNETRGKNIYVAAYIRAYTLY